MPAKKIPPFFLSLFLFINSYSQIETVTKYFIVTHEMREADNPQAKGVYEVKETDKPTIKSVYNYKDGLWQMESHFISNGQLYCKGSYKKSPDEIRQGVFEWYHENGKLLATGFFDNDKLSGLYKIWNKDGMLTDSLFYKENLLCCKGKSLDNNGNITTDYNLDDNGTGACKLFWNKNVLQAEGNYFQGIRSGKWYYYTKEGIKQWEVEYKKGQLSSATCLDALNANNESCIFEKEAEFKGGDKKWVAYLSNVLSKEGYPSRKLAKSKRQDLFGNVIAQFIVDKDGAVTDITIVHSLNEIADTIVLKALQNSPKWEPAVQYGRRVKAYRLQPVTFYESL